jgi:ABC-type bacteriocin/lantibiotic exporter with double-glycine peptidase domain
MRTLLGAIVGLILAFVPLGGEGRVSHAAGRDVPFYSQFGDIAWPSWRSKSCGVAALAMLINFYRGEGTVSPQQLLEEGISAGLYVPNVGWSHWGLVRLARRSGLEGKPYDFSMLSRDAAFARFRDILDEGPVIASVYSRFNPKSTIPHLVVVIGIEGDTVRYHDPLDGAGGRKISIEDFKRGWKKRIIVIRPQGA